MDGQFQVLIEAAHVENGLEMSPHMSSVIIDSMEPFHGNQKSVDLVDEDVDLTVSLSLESDDIGIVSFDGPTWTKLVTSRGIEPGDRMTFDDRLLLLGNLCYKLERQNANDWFVPDLPEDGNDNGAIVALNGDQGGAPGGGGPVAGAEGAAPNDVAPLASNGNANNVEAANGAALDNARAVPPNLLGDFAHFFH